MASRANPGNRGTTQTAHESADNGTIVPLDPRVAAALQLHKPFGRFSDCITCRIGPLCDPEDWPCDTAVALGVPAERPANFTEALTWWWEAHGLDPEAAAVAAALEVRSDGVPG